MKSKFKSSWIHSVQPRRQRKYRYNAPLHIRQNFVHAHLSPELRKKYGKRAIQLKSGDTVTVLRGAQKKKQGVVDRILLKQGKVYVQGVELIKREGAKIPLPLNASNLMITKLDLDDRKRKTKLEGPNEKSS